MYTIYIVYQSSNYVIYLYKYHVIFCPKYQHSVLVNGVDICLKQLIKETCGQLNVKVMKMEILSDHVHLLIEVDVLYGIHKTVKQITGYSSRILRDEFL